MAVLVVALGAGAALPAEPAAPAGTPPSPAADVPTGLTRAERDGYLEWLHSLEQTVTARAAAGVEEAAPLYPTGRVVLPGDDARSYQYLALGRALGEAEQHGLTPSRFVGEAGAAVTLARNYANAAEWDSALAWFARAARLDTAGAFAPEIGGEALAAAVALGDSTRLARWLDASVKAGVSPGRENELVLALRYLAGHRQDDALDQVLAVVSEDESELGDNLRYWYAFALVYRARYAEAIVELRQLVASGGLSRGLSEHQRAWALTALPDLFLLVGADAPARDLYRVLAASGLISVQLYAEFQLAGLDLSGQRFASAAERYGRLCEASEEGPWQDGACDLARLSSDLNRIQEEGQHDGAAAFYGR